MPTPKPAIDPSVDESALADSEAWRVAAAGRKYRVEDGAVWSGVNGMLFPLPPLPGFASLPDAQRGIVFHAVAQFATYRVGQTATGDVSAAVAKAIESGEIPTAKTNDAIEAHYLAEIAERISAKFGEVSKKTGATAEAIKARMDSVVATADAHRDALFAEIVQSGKDAALAKPLGDKKPRATKAKGEVVTL